MLLYSHARDGVGLCHKNPELRLCAVLHYNLKPMERSAPRSLKRSFVLALPVRVARRQVKSVDLSNQIRCAASIP